MRIEHRLKSLEASTQPEAPFVIVTDAAEAERWRAEHPGTTATIVITGVPRAAPPSAP